MKTAWIAAIAALICTTAQAEIYKCEQSGGRIVYSGVPCPKGTKGETVRRPGELPPPPAEWPCVGTARLKLQPLSKPSLTAAQAEALKYAQQRELAEGMRGEVLLDSVATLHLCYNQDPDRATKIDTDGTITFKRGESIERVNQRQSGLALLARCTEALTRCRDANGGNLGICFDAVPICQADDPQKDPANCCPSNCAAQFRAAKASGRDDAEAFFESFTGDKRCIDASASSQ